MHHPSCHRLAHAWVRQSFFPPRIEKRLILPEETMAHPRAGSWGRNWVPPLLSAVLSAFLAVTGCSGKQSPGHQGYVEGEFVHVSSPVEGRLVRLSVTRGKRVRAAPRL